MTYNAIDWLLSLAPMLVVLGLMVIRGWNAGRAGLAGWALALGIATLRFEAGGAVLGYAQVKALLLTADVAIIVWAALLLYMTVEQAGALAVIADALAGLTRDTTIQALLLGWVFASFLQGVGGFGVPVAITAPLLIGLGVPQVRAVVVPAIGHGWAVTFGSLAASFVMLMNVTGLSGADLAPPAALMLGVLSYLSGFMGAHALGGWREVRRVAPYVLVTGTAMALAQGVLATRGRAVDDWGDWWRPDRVGCVDPVGALAGRDGEASRYRPGSCRAAGRRFAGSIGKLGAGGLRGAGGAGAGAARHCTG